MAGEGKERGSERASKSTTSAVIDSGGRLAQMPMLTLLLLLQLQLLVLKL